MIPAHNIPIVLARKSQIPVNTAVPTISGTAQIGQTLTATTGTWTQNPTSFTSQWYRAATPIGGATASTYAPVAPDVGSTLAVSVIATNSRGSSMPATSAATSPVAQSGWPDGREGAPFGAPQYPALLAGYGLSRPPWNVAGVDYHAGVPDGQSMVDWRTFSHPQVFVNTTTGRVDTNQIPGGSVTFNNVDFSLGIGAMIYNGSGGASNITCNNCKFALPGGGGSYSSTAFAVILDQGVANITVINCSFDATSMANEGTFVSSSGNVTLKYNWFLHTKQHILEWNATTNKSVIYKYNMVDDALLDPGAHLNYLQPFVNATVTIDVQFNTVFRQGLYGGNGFQYASGFSTAVFLNPIFQNNTCIAKLDSQGQVSMSYFVSGNSGGSDGAVSGTGLNNYNYFDLSGAYGAYYPGRMTPALGWSSTGNINMNTGATITPP